MAIIGTRFRVQKRAPESTKSALYKPLTYLLTKFETPVEQANVLETWNLECAWRYFRNSSAKKFVVRQQLNKKAQLAQGLHATEPSFQDGRQPPAWILSNRK